MLDQGDTRLVFSRQANTPALALFSAQRKVDGSFASATQLPGAFSQSNVDFIAVGSTPAASGFGSELWRMNPLGSGLRNLSLSSTANASLSVSPASLSVASGGSFSFQLDTAPAWANATYTLFLGDINGTTFLPGIGTAPILQQGFTQNLVDLYSNPELADASGTLDGTGSTTAILNLPAGTPVPAQLLNRDLGVCFLAQNGSAAFLSERVVIRILP